MDDLIQKIKIRASDPSSIHDMAIGLSPVPSIGPKAAINDIATIENDLGFRLPGILKEIYSEIGDGGFGPGYGLYPIKTSVEIYLTSLSNDESKRGKLPVCTWGCGIESLVDCLDQNNPVYVEREENDSEECGCMSNLEFTIKDKDGNVISSGNGGLNEILSGLGGNASVKKSAGEKKKITKKLVLHKNSLKEWFDNWVNGKDLWSEMEKL